MKQVLTFVLVTLIISSCNNSSKIDNKINLRLKWAYQSQFAGYLVAQEKGFYKDAGLDVNIQPAGPDLKPYSTVASGSDDIGIGIITQIITARSNGVPLVAIAQILQDSPNRFVLKKKNQISSLVDLKGKKVGLWLGGDEIEFVAMLKTVGMTLKDVQVVPQKFSIAPFLQDEYVCTQVMTYNELNQINAQGYPNDSLQIISPEHYKSAVLGDLIFTNEKYLKSKSSQLEKFLNASFRGWEYAEQHPDEAVNIVLKYNSELDRTEQLKQLQSVISLIRAERGVGKGMGYIDSSSYRNAKEILLGGLSPTSSEYGNIRSVDISKCYSEKILNKDKQQSP